MNKLEAKNLIVNTFEKSFNEAQFTYFIKNLINNLDETKRKEYRGQYVPDSFNDAVKHYKRIGQYKDSKNNVIDVLVVNLNRGTSLERARSLQRNFIARYLKQRTHDAALVAYYTDGSNDWRFSLVKMDINLNDKKIETDFSPARRYSFLVGTNEGSHTAQNQFVKLLSEKEENPTLDSIEDVFNIETVTKEFFFKYRDLFIRVKQSLDKVIKNNPFLADEFNTKEINSVDFSKKLLGQIVFLYFLQKKGWFGVDKNSKWGSGSRKFLREIFENKHGSYNNFFNDILEPLFYEALSDDRSSKDHYYSRFNCKIPFLNGGLFDAIGNYDWVKTDIVLPNELFSNNHQTKEGDIGDGILDVFDRYNFTVIEDEPLEKEVAIDPELLGKAYEKFNAIRPDNFNEYLQVLKSGKKGEETKFNKQYGVFYTPREIVHYMCQQSLINYLATELDGKVSKEAIEFLILEGEKFVEHLRTAKEKNENNDDYSGKYKEYPQFVQLKEHANEIDNLLANLKMCDPAVGSGAFPVGMMTEIVKARMFFVITYCLPDEYTNLHNQLVPSGKLNRNSYNFKRDCIENSLYGVDIDPGAVEIAKLRLWLSLVVDEDDISNIKPLPNLDYKIVCGNSLLGVEKNFFNKSYLEDLEKLKQLYFNETNPTKKKEYKCQIDKVILQIIDGLKDFDFEIYFSEVFHLNDGFDIFIGNPPYVFTRKSDFSQSFKLLVKKLYPLLFNLKSNSRANQSGKINLYSLFIVKGLQLLKSNGHLSYIIPNNILRTTTYDNVRKYILNNSSIITIVDLGSGVFEDVTASTIVLILQNENDSSIRLNNSLNVFYNLVDLEFNLYDKREIVQNRFVTNTSYSFNIYVDEIKKDLSDKIIKQNKKLGSFCIDIIEGIVAHKDLIKDTPVKNSFPLLEGKCIKPFFIQPNRKYIIWNKSKIHRSRPDYLWSSNKKILLQRISGGSHPLVAALDCNYNKTFASINNILLKPEFNHLYVYITALLNSTLINWFYANNYSNNSTLTVNISKTYLEQLPVIIPSQAIIKIIEDSVKKIPSHPSIINQINIIFYKLYNLTYEEVEIVDPQIGNIISKSDYDNFILQ